MLTPHALLLMARGWLILGALSLIYASAKLFRHGLDEGLMSSHLYWVIPLAIFVGAFKGRVVMRKHMRANIERISASTEKLGFWHIYPARLLGFIALMILGMAFLKRALVGSGPGLGALGGVDLAVAVALGVASFEYGAAAAQEQPSGL